jgi:subtilisin family serine protease
MTATRIVLVVVLMTLATGVFAQKTSENWVADEVLIKIAGGAENRATEALTVDGATSVERLGDLGWRRFKIPAGMSVEEAVAKYRKVEGVLDVQPNFYYHLLLTPNDTLFTNSAMYGLGRINAPAAWDLTTGSSSVVVADIDSGLRYTHRDLAANSWVNPGEIAGNGVDDDGNGFADDVNGWDFFYNDNNPINDCFTSTCGHGTHTAGTIGAVGNNLTDVVGVNWNVKIMGVKIYSPNGADSTSAMLVNAYNYVRMMKLRGVNIRVTNNSYGGCGEACGYDQATKDALDAMGNAGILNVFAAGNDNINNDVTPSYPVSYTSPSVLGVAASTNTDAKASFSSYGPISVDVAAPGNGILSTYSSSTSPDSATTTLSGTSMATPHVAGAAALLSAFNPNLSPASLKATLMNTVDPVAAWTTLIKTGGRINVFRALQNQTVCNFAPAQSTINVGTKGGYVSFDVAPGSNCDYFVRSNASWIKVQGVDTRSGSSTVTFRVTMNPTITRTGTITVGDQTVTVRQSRS